MASRGADEGEEVRAASARLIEDVTLDLRDMMKAQGMTQADLRRRINAKPSWVNRIYHGAENLSLKTLAKLAHGLGCRVEVRFYPLVKTDEPAEPFRES